MSALYSFLAVIVVLIAYCAGYHRGKTYLHKELMEWMDEEVKQGEREDKARRDRRRPVGSTEPVRWDDTQPGSEP